MAHIVLLGDSIFDNKVYTGNDPSVTEHLTALAGEKHRVTLLAIDGSVTDQVQAQADRIPADATHLIVSSGGNDALQYIGLLETPAQRMGEAFAVMDEPVARFRTSYRSLVTALAERGLPIVACTIYNGNLEPQIVAAARGAVALFNDVIYREATAAGARVIDLRDVCTEPADYANPIEPSGQGGLKIARSIAKAISRRAR